MAADDLIQMDGTVVDVNRSLFTVEVVKQDKNGVESTHRVTATLMGKMRQMKIRVVLGDRVRIGVSPYDLTKGRIEFRYKD